MSIPLNASHLTRREKIGQTCQIHGKEIAGLADDQLAAYLHERPIGSVFLGSEIIGSDGDCAEGLQVLIERLQRESPIPLSISGDLENGAGGAVRGLTAFPVNLALGAVNDPAEAYEYGKWTAVEAARIGFNWTFGPVVDLSLNWLNPIVSVRSLGSFPDRVAELASALIRGLQDHGLSATAKHFPGDGVDFRDQHLCVSVNSFSEQEWQRTFGRVYEACFAAGVHSVMAGHIALPWIEPGTGTGRAPLPGTTSRCILHELLRERMGYEGVVVSDALIMAGFRGRTSGQENLIVEAFHAGIDVMLWPGPHYFDLMERALESGRISEERLDQSVNRILAMKARQQLALKPVTPRASSSWQEPGAARLADSVAERCLTLIKNEQNLLPLDASKTSRVLVVLGTPQEQNAEARLQPLLDGLRRRGMTVDLHINGNCLDLRKREEAGERFQVLIAIFELGTHSLKNTMRPTGPMAECMWTIQGLQSVEPIIVSLGSPYLLNDMPWADTCINAYSSNPHTLKALEAALFGDIPFAGISPVQESGVWLMTDGQ